MFPTLPALAKPLSSPISQPFKRSQLGLFGGKTKQYGNNVPFSKHKTRRSWLPNVQSKRLTSEALGEELKLKVTTRALRSIKKAGSLDNYLIKTRHETLGFEGLRLRILVRQARKDASESSEDPAEKARVSAVRKALKSRKADVHRAVSAQRPTLEDARREREEAISEMRARGLLGEGETVRSPKQLLNFLTQRRAERSELLKDFPPA